MPIYHLTYLWYDSQHRIRSKVKIQEIALTPDKSCLQLSDIPEWNFDGSSCGIATTKNSEVCLKPVAFRFNPFSDGFEGYQYFVICDNYIYNSDGKLIPDAASSPRITAAQIFDKYLDEEPWFAIEMEFFLLASKTHFPEEMDTLNTLPDDSRDTFYCGVGKNNIWYRDIITQTIKLSVAAGVKISGSNAEVAPSQWEIQVGPSVGIKIGDDVMIFKYILHRVTEKYPVYASFDPKPLTGNWNGSGAHTNFSTLSMRNGNGGWKLFENILSNLEKKHADHIANYGDNEKRLTGTHETSDKEKFSWGVGDRSASIRIPRSVWREKKGYLEDRRPASDMEPYTVASLIMETIMEEEADSDSLSQKVIPDDASQISEASLIKPLEEDLNEDKK